MANDILTAKNAPGVTAKLSAANILEKALFCKSVSKEDSSLWSDAYKSSSPGDTIYVKRPAQFTVGSSLDITSAIQDIKDTKVALTLDKVATTAIKMSSLEIAYDKPIKYWNDNYVEPVMAALAGNLDTWALEKAARYTNNLVGTAGTQPGAIRGFLNARQKLVENDCPLDNKAFFFINPATNTETVDVRKGLFNKSSLISDNYEWGYIGTGEGFNYMEGNFLPTFTNGADVTGIALETSGQAISNGMTTMFVDGVTSGATITKGSVFTVANVFDVHPITKVALPTLKQFTVLADVTEVSANSVIISFSPAMYYTADGRQNISAIPVDEAALVFFGAASTAYQQNLGCHKEAFRLATVPLHLPKNQEFAAQETIDGITVSVVRGFDIRTREEILRFDLLAGLAAVRPEWSVRYSG